MRFKTPLKVTSIPGTANWVLDDDLDYTASDGRLFRAPKGSITDFFSIPGVLRGVFFRARRYAEASVLHDAAYRGTLEECVVGVWDTAIISRAYSDDMLLKEPLEVLGAPSSLVRATYLGVRAGGYWSFKGAARGATTPED